MPAAAISAMTPAPRTWATAVATSAATSAATPAPRTGETAAATTAATPEPRAHASTVRASAADAAVGSKRRKTLAGDDDLRRLNDGYSTWSLTQQRRREVSIKCRQKTSEKHAELDMRASDLLPTWQAWVKHARRRRFESYKMWEIILQARRRVDIEERVNTELEEATRELAVLDNAFLSCNLSVLVHVTDDPAYRSNLNDFVPLLQRIDTASRIRATTYQRTMAQHQKLRLSRARP